MLDSQLIDPLGRTITLHETTWARHILSGHPELANHRILVESTITNPKIITHSSSDTDCRLYHGPGPRPKVMIRVVVDVVRGFVKTAHFVGKVSAAEVIEWSSQAP
jgi:hypothetical protein